MEQRLSNIINNYIEVARKYKDSDKVNRYNGFRFGELYLIRKECKLSSDDMAVIYEFGEFLVNINGVDDSKEFLYKIDRLEYAINTGRSILECTGLADEQNHIEKKCKDDEDEEERKHRDEQLADAILYYLQNNK